MCWTVLVLVVVWTYFVLLLRFMLSSTHLTRISQKVPSRPGHKILLAILPAGSSSRAFHALWLSRSTGNIRTYCRVCSMDLRARCIWADSDFAGACTDLLMVTYSSGLTTLSDVRISQGYSVACFNEEMFIKLVLDVYEQVESIAGVCNNTCA